MKKLLLITGIVLSIGTFTTGFSNQANAEKLDNSIKVTKNSKITQENIDSRSTKEPNDGVNDPSTVNLKVRKISNDNILSSLQVEKSGYIESSTLSQDLNNNTFTTYASGWQYLGSSTFANNSKVFYSGGGYILIYIYQPFIGPNFSWKYQLREQDPMLHDTVASWEHVNQSGTYEVKLYVDSFVDSDGQSGKAELYLKKLTNSTTSVSSDWYD